MGLILTTALFLVPGDKIDHSVLGAQIEILGDTPNLPYISKWKSKGGGGDVFQLEQLWVMYMLFGGWGGGGGELGPIDKLRQNCFRFKRHTTNSQKLKGQVNLNPSFQALSSLISPDLYKVTFFCLRDHAITLVFHHQSFSKQPIFLFNCLDPQQNESITWVYTYATPPIIKPNT